MLQHLIILAIVLACLAWLAKGFYKSICHGRGGIGKCCSRGCGDVSQSPKKQAVTFMPAEFLRKKRP